MKTLFINSAFREGSRTLSLAEYYLENFCDDYETVCIGSAGIAPLDGKSLAVYNRSVAEHNFEDKMFDAAKQFAAAEEIIIAAPFWNYGIPAALHDYLELVCSQGVTFDMDDKGNYFSLCNAKKLVFITTAGGYIPENDCSVGYIKQLCDVFWKIDDVRIYKAEGLDIWGNDIEKILSDTEKEMEK